jgi:hypothetical protein
MPLIINKQTTMKTLIALFSVTLLTISISNTAFAQNEGSERDIRIAERILDELFADVSDANNGFPFSDEPSVKGEYIPGVGLHFSVGENYFSKVTNMSGSISIKEDDGPERSFTFDRKDTGERLERGEIEERLNEYFTSYASQLRSVKDSEELRITFGLNTNTNRWVAAFQSPESDSLDETKQAVSKWVSGRDLRRVREGDITSEALLQRIETVTIPQDEQPRDIEIFSSILETAIRDLEFEGVRVNRTVRSNYIPGWGVRYYISANSRGGGIFSFLTDADREEIEADIETAFEFDAEDREDFDIDVDELRSEYDGPVVMMDTLNISSALSETMDSLAVALPKLMDSLKVAMPRMMESMKVMFEPEEVPGDDVLMADMDHLQSEVYDIVEGYGSTLNSLSDDEYLMISINWRGRSTAIPDRRIFYISKQDMENNRELMSLEL